jgi:site-specific DNA recombinase
LAASVPIRVKLGKSLGGAAPYGYKWVNEKLEIDEDKALVIKLVHKLFTKHKHQRTVARMINQMGYRTRRNKPFVDNSLDR